MTILYVLVGVPGSGKTTWIGHQTFNWDRTVHVSTDQFVEKYARTVGKTYKEVFEYVMPSAVSQMAMQARKGFVDDKIVVWDQTSTTILSRAKKLRMCPEHYTKIAVVFDTPGPETHAKFLDRPGKEIPNEVIADMIKNFETPTIEEGFDKIIKARLLGIE